MALSENRPGGIPAEIRRRFNAGETDTIGSSTVTGEPVGVYFSHGDHSVTAYCAPEGEALGTIGATARTEADLRGVLFMSKVALPRIEEGQETGTVDTSTKKEYRMPPSWLSDIG